LFESIIYTYFVFQSTLKLSTMKNNRLQLMIFGIMGILSIPLIAMQFTNEVN